MVTWHLFRSAGLQAGSSTRKDAGLEAGATGMERVS
jgi:hypothetical protein